MSVQNSRKELRHNDILETLETNPTIRVNQLAESLSVSTETIRRDLAELQQVGRISRTYGGAVSATNRAEPALSERMILQVAERRAIAQLAVQLFGGSEALLLGGGSTMLHFAKTLRKSVKQRISVITPSYPIAIELAGNPLIDVRMPPGRLEPHELIVYGPETQRAIEQYSFNIALIGASGLNEEGVSEALLSAGEVYSSILRSASRTVILADHEKFGKRALALLSPWKSNLTVVTDEDPPPAILSSLAANGVELHIAHI